MLNTGKKFHAMRDKKNKYSNSCVVRKKNSERKKKHNPPFKLNGRSLITHTGWFLFSVTFIQSLYTRYT
jgi:hypothetical protein